MAKERVKKKSFQKSLEEIKEKMKEKRNKRLASVSGPNRGRSRGITTCNNGTSSTNTILKGVQQNNKALAVALQTEKEKVRQGNAVILQLKREQQALFLHLLLLKKKLKEQEALSANSSENSSSNNIAQTESRKSLHNKSVTETPPQKGSPVCADKNHSDKFVVLPPTVGVRRRQTDRSNSRRRSERVQEQKITRGDSVARLASSICIDDAIQKQTHGADEPMFEEPIEEFQHSTPEPAPTRSAKQPQPGRKQQSRSKTDPAQKKPERGRKPERGPLKKPWENPKPRTRSKSRDRSTTRSKAAPTSQSKLNTSLGFNDTFDFDCEEAVHVTPFKAKAEDNEPASSVSKATQSEEAADAPAVVFKGEDSLSSTSSESEDSLYVPQKSRKKHSSPENIKAINTRRGRHSKKVTDENIPPQKEFAVYIEEDSCSKVERSKKEKISEEQQGIYEENEAADPQEADIEEHCLQPVSPLVEAEIKRIDDVLSNFGQSFNDSPLRSDQASQRVKPCKRRGLGVRPMGRGLSLCDVTNFSPAAYRKYPCGASHLSAARCSTPAQAPSRKRRCTMTVDYKEPSLIAKLRRGDKFTDLEFLRSPIFKQKSGRRSVQKSRDSMKVQQPFEKYNESFVGCL